jgi:hypothetical protein
MSTVNSVVCGGQEVGGVSYLGTANDKRLWGENGSIVVHCCDLNAIVHICYREVKTDPANVWV